MPHHVHETSLKKSSIFGPSVVEEIAADVLQGEEKSTHRSRLSPGVGLGKKPALEVACELEISFE